MRFLGHRHDIPGLMAACDVVCHTTRVPDRLRMVVVEAVAQLRPVIATSAGRPLESIVSGRDGLQTFAGDAAAFASAMIDPFDAPGFVAYSVRVRGRR